MIELLKERAKTVDGMKATIVEFYTLYVDDTAKIDGSKWYESANLVAVMLSDRYDITVPQAAGCISALSPSVLWESNILDAETLIKGYNAGLSVDKITVSTYGQNKDKCFRILDSDGSVEAVRDQFNEGTKTHAFYWNILCMDTTTYVTVDRHAVGVALASNGSDHLRLSVTPKRYRDISEAYRLAARVLGYTAPCMLQAACWVAYRDNFGGRPTADSDVYETAPF
jgi:hypothetical protein